MAYNYIVMRLNAITMLPTFIGLSTAAAWLRCVSMMLRIKFLHQ